MNSNLNKLTALVSVLGTMTALLALCCATICRGFDGTPPIGAKYCMIALGCLFTLTLVVGIITFRQRKSRSETS